MRKRVEMRGKIARHPTPTRKEKKNIHDRPDAPARASHQNCRLSVDD